jgi:hypothetical protein
MLAKLRIIYVLVILPDHYLSTSPEQWLSKCQRVVFWDTFARSGFPAALLIPRRDHYVWRCRGQDLVI